MSSEINDKNIIENGTENNLKVLLEEAKTLVGNNSSQSTTFQEEQLKSLNLNCNGLQNQQQKSSKSIQELFVQQCLQQLCKIQNALENQIATNETPTEKDYLGVRDLRLVHTLLQVVISWGMYPCFSPGVGVPLSKRVKSGYTNHELLSNQEGEEVSSNLKYSSQYLFKITDQLMGIVSSNDKNVGKKAGTTVATILLVRHLPDLYAALLQLAYQPISINPSSSVSPASSNNNMTNQQQFSPATIFSNPITEVKDEVNLTAKEKDKCARMFMWLFEKSDMYRAMESLMLLLGTSPLHPVPAWLRSICGRFLSRILLKPKGVSVVLEFTIGDSSQVQLTELEKVTKLVLSVPRQMTSVESYYAVITPQLLELLKNARPPYNSKDQAVTFIIGRIISKHPVLGKKYIVDPITGPLIKYWQYRKYDFNNDNNRMGNDDDDPIVVNDTELNSIIHLLHSVMIGEPSAIVIQTFMSSSILALYHLYDFTCKTKSGLRESVLDLLTTYFRIITTKDAVDDFKKIIMDQSSIKGEQLAYYAPSSSGDVVLRLRKKKQVLHSNELPLDIDILLNFLQSLNDQNLCGDFFVYLLNVYTTMQDTSSSTTDPKSVLLILQLIMGMADTMGPDILGKPTQILLFANNIVTEHINRLNKIEQQQNQSYENKKKNIGLSDLSNIINDDQRELLDDLHDEDFTMEDDIESLLLAINLIRAVIHENEELDLKSTQLLASMLDTLKRLEKYGGELMYDQIHEVILAITSHLLAHDMSKQGKTKGDDKLEQSKLKYQDAMKSLQDELLPIRAHGMGILKDMVLDHDPLISSGTQLDIVLDLFIHLAQDEDSFIYLNAIKGLSALTDIHGNRIIEKLGKIYSDEKESLDNRLRIGEALLQTVQRCGDALGTYLNTLIKPLEEVLSNKKETNIHLRVSALSILSTACQTCPTAMHGILWELTDWVLNILDFEKAPEIRRAGTVLILSLFRGLASKTLYDFPTDNLKRAYRTLRYIEHNDPDELTRYQARVALSDLDVIMRGEIFKN
ncbi:unnamed protein product [Cunninghamella blakesleeana]